MDKRIKKAYDSVELSEKNRQRVLDRLIAEENKDRRITMTMTKTEKKSRRLAKRSAGMVAAACIAAMMTISAGAYAYSQFMHKSSVERYLGQQTADLLENNGLALNEVKENEHLRLTADAVLSDGQSAEMIFTLEKLDDKARELINGLPSPSLRYADTGEEFIPHGSSTAIYFGEDGENDPSADIFSFVVRIPPTGTDFSRPITLFFPPYFEQETSYLFEGIEFPLDMTKNIETATLTDGSGVELLFSSFGVSATQLPYSEDDCYDMDNIYMLKADGTREAVPVNIDLCYSGGSQVRVTAAAVETTDERTDGEETYEVVTTYGFNDEAADGFFSLFVPTLYNIDDYIGVEINGVQYLKG